nr:putative RNA-directed DNA polymerase, eukaryota, reverse transcriptase zinc-binding domain protein [Tanacetum cinerariifolium]
SKYMEEDASSKKLLVSSIIDKLLPSWKDFKHTLKHGKDDLPLVQLGSHLRIEDSLRAQDSDKGKGKEVDAIAWWVDSGATTHVCKDRCWFKTYEPVEDGYVLYMGDDHFAPVYEKGNVVLEFSSGKSITLFNVLYVPKLQSKDAIFDENRFFSIPRPKDIILNLDESQRDDHSNDVPSETLEPRKGSAFWKEAVDDEIGSIIENNTWVLSDLPPDCKPLNAQLPGWRYGLPGHIADVA